MCDSHKQLRRLLYSHYIVDKTVDIVNTNVTLAEAN